MKNRILEELNIKEINKEMLSEAEILEKVEQNYLECHIEL